MIRVPETVKCHHRYIVGILAEQREGERYR